MESVSSIIHVSTLRFRARLTMAPSPTFAPLLQQIEDQLNGGGATEHAAAPTSAGASSDGGGSDGVLGTGAGAPSEELPKPVRSQLNVESALRQTVR